MEDYQQMEVVNNRIITLRGQQVIIDRDVAELYGVATRDINKSVKNNPDKFPEGYVITLQGDEKQQLVENFDRFDSMKHSTVAPKAFTEQGLYMLATILKSPLATQTTSNFPNKNSCDNSLKLYIFHNKSPLNTSRGFCYLFYNYLFPFDDINTSWERFRHFRVVNTT